MPSAPWLRGAIHALCRATAGCLLAAAPAVAQSAGPGASQPPRAVRPQVPQVEIRGGPWAGTYRTPPSSTVCTQGLSQPGRWDIQASDATGDLTFQLSANLPPQGGSTQHFAAMWAVGVMNVDTGENPPDGIITLDGQRTGSGRLGIQRTGRSVTVTLDGRTAAGVQILATLGCGELVEF